MAKMVIGVYQDRNAAEAAISKLNAAGYSSQDISVVMKDSAQSQELARDTGASVAEGATSGAVTGGAIGALAGLLIGVGAITIPGIGGVLIGGPLAAALGLTGAAATTVSGAATGALGGGIVGALIGLGVPETEAREYQTYIEQDAVILTVPVNDSITTTADSILRDTGAQSVRTIDVPNS